VRHSVRPVVRPKQDFVELILLLSLHRLLVFHYPQSDLVRGATITHGDICILVPYADTAMLHLMADGTFVIALPNRQTMFLARILTARYTLWVSIE